MTINLTVPTSNSPKELKPRISVIGVGGAGGNAVNNMIQMGLEGVEFIVANSDAQALANSSSERKIQMGTEVTKGLGAGSNPTIGRAAAEESLEEILTHLHDVNMVFVTAGLGGGTGTGAAPVIAKVARDHGILTVGVVTKPFQFEGGNRMKIAEMGLEELQQYVDTLLIIPNQNLFRVANEKTTFADAFKMADDVLYSGVRGVTDLMVMPGLINLDFADIRSVMSEMGKAMMGTGEAEGERRAIDAAEAAIANPLLDDASMNGAKGVLINITAGRDITLFEVDEAANRIRDEVAEDANIIFGSTFEESLEGSIRVSVVATGIEVVAGNRVTPIAIKAADVTRNNESILDPITAMNAREKPVTLLSSEQQTMEEVPEASILEKDEESTELEQKDLIEQIVKSKKELSESTNQLETAYSTSSDEVFIPASPVDATSNLETTADPFAVADMINAGTEKDKEKVSKKPGPSLMERVTRATLGQRISGSKKRVMPDSPATTRPSMVSNPTPVNHLNGDPENVLLNDSTLSELENNGSTGRVFEKTPEAAENNKLLINSGPDGKMGQETEQVLASDAEFATPTLLGDVDTEQNLTHDAPDEDLLDIPAFLRRQAN